MRDIVIKQLESSIKSGCSSLDALLAPIDIPKSSPLYKHKCAAKKGDQRIMCLFTLYGIMADGAPIIIEYDKKGNYKGLK